MPSILISLAAGLGLIFGLLGGVFMAVPKVHLPPPPAAAPKLIGNDLMPQAKTFDDFSKIAAELDAWRTELTEKNNKALLLDAELARREQVLDAERDALDKERARLDKVQKDMEDRLIQIKENEVPRLQEMADLYSTMKPADAVILMRSLPQDQATRILTVMKQKTQAKLLSAWIETFPADKDVVAQITSDLMRTMNEPADATTTAAADTGADAAAPAGMDTGTGAGAPAGADTGAGTGPTASPDASATPAPTPASAPASATPPATPATP